MGDEVGSLTRRCGQPLSSVTSALPESYATICHLRPKRWLRFTVEAFNTDSQPRKPGSAITEIGDVSHASMEVISPPSAPSVIKTLVTQPADQESIAGFRPKAVLDWIPQHDDLIMGHAVYLGLRELDAMKLLCWVPHNHSRYAAGSLEMPIVHMNHTYTQDTLLLRDYMAHFHVHQEQELLIATRTKGHLESPPRSFRLGEWLIIETLLKCLTSFEASHPAYVSMPIHLSWTQEQEMSLYD